MKSLLIAIALLAAGPALGQTAHPPLVPHRVVPRTAAPVPPDDNAVITLTLGELKTFVAAQIANARAQDAQAAAAGVTQKLNSELAPKK